MTMINHIKRGIRFFLNNIPSKHVSASITKLAPSELLQDRAAFITGGTSGIGFAIAKSFLESGASVIITGRTEDRLRNACTQLRSTENSGKVYGVVMNNAHVSSFRNIFNHALELLDGKQMSILVNNAGILGGHISSSTESEYNSVLDTNLKGVFFLSQLVGKYMKDNHIKGNILNIASSSSLRPAASAYTISKWGIRGLTLGLAKSLIPYGIVVNGIAPGPTATPMLIKEEPHQNINLSNSPIGRYITSEEIANMSVILTSGLGRSIVGDIIYMTGGAGLITFDDMTYPF